MDPRTQPIVRNFDNLNFGKEPKKPRVANLCPFGCPDVRLNEFGYCRHLVGFTIDGENMDARQLFQGTGKTTDKDGNTLRGNTVRTIPAKVQDGDVVRVVPAVGDDGTPATPKPTATMRVYRKSGQLGPLPFFEVQSQVPREHDEYTDEQVDAAAEAYRQMMSEAAEPDEEPEQAAKGKRRKTEEQPA